MTTTTNSNGRSAGVILALVPTGLALAILAVIARLIPNT
jgi:hypothetical protein